MRHARRGRRGRGRQEHDELVTSVARDHVLAADCVHQRVRDLAEQRIAGKVTVGVVDPLELIDVEKDDGEALATCGRARDLLIEPLEEQAPIVEPGERVVTRLALEIVMELRHLEAGGELRAHRRHQCDIRLGERVCLLAFGV